MTTDAGIWVRVSSGGQDEANQVPDLLRYCDQHDYNAKITYTVHGKSASKGRHQKDLDQALADMRAGLIRVLVIWHSDRIERRPGKALLDLLAEFSAAGGRVESVKEPTLGQLDFGSQVTTFIAGLVNHEKSRHLSEQVGMAYERIRENSALQGRPPFGLTTEGPKYERRLVPTEEGRRLVPEVYERVIRGESLGVIAAWLTRETGRAWWAKSVAALVRNPTYRGQRCEQDPVTKLYGAMLHKCEPIVDAGTWKRANDNLDRRPKRGKVYAANRAMLSGALTCPRCGGPMYRVNSLTSRQGQPVKVPYYRCSGTGPNRKSECRNMVPVGLADNAVSEIIGRRFNGPVMIRTLVPGRNHDAELTDLRYEMQQLSLRGLSWDEEDAERARLRAEYDRIAALPSVPDRWEETPAGETYSQVWERLPVSERGPWLRSEGFVVTANREAVTVAQGTTSSTVLL